MGRKILIITFVLTLVLCFASCKAKKSESEGATTEAQTTTVVSTQKQTEKQTTQKASEKPAKKSAISKKETTAKNSDGEAVTKNNSDGTFTFKGVKTDVVKYSGATLDDGKNLIESLIKGAVKDSKILESTRKDNCITYLVSGTNAKTNKTRYFKLQYIQDVSTGYLITFSADSADVFNKDLSYVTDNYKKFAR